MTDPALLRLESAKDQRIPRAVEVYEGAIYLGFLDKTGEIAPSPKFLPSPETSPEAFAKVLLRLCGTHAKFVDMYAVELVSSVRDLSEQKSWTLDLSRVDRWVKFGRAMSSASPPVLGKIGAELKQADPKLRFRFEVGDKGFSISTESAEGSSSLWPPLGRSWRFGDVDNLSHALLRELPLVSRQLELLQDPLAKGLAKLTFAEDFALYSSQLIDWAAIQLVQHEMQGDRLQEPSRHEIQPEPIRNLGREL